MRCNDRSQFEFMGLMSINCSTAAPERFILSPEKAVESMSKIYGVFIPELAHLDHDDVSQADEEGQLVLDREKVVVRQPPLYRVLLLNDDYTPMDFVVETLQQLFGFSHEKATETMLKVHNQGYALCGVFTRDVAETKVAQVLDFAREHQHPLFCRAEPQEE